MEKQKVAVAIVHGLGRQKADFAQVFIERLNEEWKRCLQRDNLDPQQQPILCKPVYWAQIAEENEKKLWDKYTNSGLKWKDLRQFVFGYLGDAIAYQKPIQRNDFIYDQINQQFKLTLKKLAHECGETAPLCVIANSLGTVISCEVIKELQRARYNPHITPLEQTRTLTNLYTMGSPLPMWSLREEHFGTAPIVPASTLKQYYPQLQGEWINYYSKYDVLSYPLKLINASYDRQVKRDQSVVVGDLMKRYTPLSHGYYASSKRVIRSIAHSIYSIWYTINK